MEKKESKKNSSNNNLDKIAIFISSIALIMSAFVTVLQFSPFLRCSDLKFRSDGKKLFFYIKNDGNIPTNQIRGGLCIIANKEKKEGVPEDVKVPLYKDFKFIDDFYPGIDKDSVPIIISFDEPFKIDEIKDAVHFLIYFDYPQFGSLGLPFFKKEYRGVFYKNPDGSWCIQSKALFPELFKKIFADLKGSKRPSF